MEGNKSMLDSSRENLANFLYVENCYVSFVYWRYIVFKTKAVGFITDRKLNREHSSWVSV